MAEKKHSDAPQAGAEITQAGAEITQAGAEITQAGAEITQTAEDSPGGVEGAQVAPTADRSDKDLKADMTVPADADQGALKEPEHEADQSPYPVQDQPPLERPPFATARPDVPIVSSMIKGAGAHTPPPPDQFTPDGRPRL